MRFRKIMKSKKTQLLYTGRVRVRISGKWISARRFRIEKKRKYNPTNSYE